MVEQQSYNRERLSINVARLKKSGQVFQIVVDPDLALDYTKGKQVDIREVLKSEEIFEDPKKGLRSSKTNLENIFGTTDTIEIAKTILAKGELQVTSEQREREIEEKKKKILNLIHVNAIDPSTDAPHPLQRIENAFEEANIRIDPEKGAEEQVEGIVKDLLPILPIKFAKRQLEIVLPAAYATKLYSLVKNYGTFQQEDWLSDGSWRVLLEIPAGLQTEVIDTLNSKTHGEATINIRK